MICENCGEEKDDVRERLDPFAEDVNGVEILVIICDDCDREFAQDI